MHIETYDYFCNSIDNLIKYSHLIKSNGYSSSDTPLKLELLQKLAVRIGTELESFHGQYLSEISALEEYCELLYSASLSENHTTFTNIMQRGMILLEDSILPLKDTVCPAQNEYSLDIIGSCVSRVPFINGSLTQHGTVNSYLKMQHFFDKNNIICCMMPVPFLTEEIDSIPASELWDTSRIHALRQALNKSTLSLLSEGKSDYLVLDFFDFQIEHAIFNNIPFSTCAHEFLNTNLFRKHISDIGLFHWKDISPSLYYPYVDLFFQEVLKIFDCNHIILNRFQAVSHYIDKKFHVQPVPAVFMQPFQANYHYNYLVRQLEDYVIEKYQPYVIDLTKYFIGDENKWENIQGAHFQNEYYTESLSIMKNIIFNQPSQKVFDQLTPEIVVRIFSSNLNDMEFESYLHNVSCIPLCTGYSLDAAFSHLNVEDIVSNRQAILAEYEKLCIP